MSRTPSRKRGDDEQDPGPHAATLFWHYQNLVEVFDSDAVARNHDPNRAKLRRETGLTDEEIEEWARMLARSPNLRRRLQGEYPDADPEVIRRKWLAIVAPESKDGAHSRQGDQKSKGSSGKKKRR